MRYGCDPEILTAWPHLTAAICVVVVVVVGRGQGRARTEVATEECEGVHSEAA